MSHQLRLDDLQLFPVVAADVTVAVAGGEMEGWGEREGRDGLVLVWCGALGSPPSAVPAWAAGRERGTDGARSGLGHLTDG